MNTKKMIQIKSVIEKFKKINKINSISIIVQLPLTSTK